MDKREIIQMENALIDLQKKSMAIQGIHLVSGATTVTGHFYGFSVGSTKPDTLKVIPITGKVYINGVALASTDDLVNFVSEGEFVPVEFTSITLTGAGYVKCYSK